MKLIGAGLPRTGTLSQKIALEMLGLGPCYHMVDVLSDLDEVDAWRRVLEGDLTASEVLDDRPATVDWPGSFFWRELVDANPDAKVLLSVRSGESWARSMRATIWGVIYGDIMIRHLSDARVHVDPQWGEYVELMSEMWQRSGLMTDASTTADEMAAAMKRHNQDIVKAIPSDRLLVWTPSDGWEPLCRFLELPEPDAPFPRVNDSAQFADRIVQGTMAAIERAREAAPAAR